MSGLDLVSFGPGALCEAVQQNAAEEGLQAHHAGRSGGWGALRHVRSGAQRINRDTTETRSKVNEGLESTSPSGSHEQLIRPFAPQRGNAPDSAGFTVEAFT